MEGLAPFPGGEEDQGGQGDPELGGLQVGHSTSQTHVLNYFEVVFCIRPTDSMPRALPPELCCLGHWAGLYPVEAAGTHQWEDGQREVSLICAPQTTSPGREVVWSLPRPTSSSPESGPGEATGCCWRMVWESGSQPVERTSPGSQR